MKPRNAPVGQGNRNYQGYTAVEESTHADGTLLRRILRRPAPGNPFTRQTKINAYNFPFTFNPGSGCFYQCVYCFLRQPFFQRHVSADHGREMNFLPGLPDSTVRFLKRHAHLPQYMKRVQMGVTTELFMPQMQPYTRMREVLEAFRDHGPDWMIHMVTKSPKILDYADLLAEMKHQVQVEVSFVTLDENTSRIFEQGTPSVRQRLQIVESLAAKGVFVRFMMMPVLRQYRLLEVNDSREIVFRNSRTGEERPGKKVTGRVDGNFAADDIELKIHNGRRWCSVDNAMDWQPVLECDWSLSAQAQQNWRRYGAMAYKQKDLNYFHVDELIDAHREARAPKCERGRLEDPSAEVLIHSGESVRDPQNHLRHANVHAYHLPRKTWPHKSTPPPLRRHVMDFGYRFHSPINWVDCK